MKKTTTNNDNVSTTNRRGVDNGGAAALASKGMVLLAPIMDAEDEERNGGKCMSMTTNTESAPKQTNGIQRKSSENYRVLKTVVVAKQVLAATSRGKNEPYVVFIKTKQRTEQDEYG